MRNGLGYALQPMRQYALRRVWHFTTDEQIAHTCETLCIGNSVQSFFNGTLRISGTATTGIVGSTAQEAYPMAKVFLSYSIQDGLDLAQQIEKFEDTIVKTEVLPNPILLHRNVRRRTLDTFLE